MRVHLAQLLRFGSTLLFVAAVAMYLLLPAINAQHVASTHAVGTHAVGTHAVGTHATETTHADHVGHHDHDTDHQAPAEGDSGCDICHLIGTLSHGADLPTPTMLVAIDISSPEHIFAAEQLCVSGAVYVSPAAPRAPPQA